MKITESRLRKFIRESVSERASVKKLRIFDFDDTLVMTNSFIKIKKQNGEIMQITPAQYAVYDKEDDDIFDFSDFSKVNDPLIIKWTFKILERVIAARDRGEGDVIILTARSSESQRAIKDFFANNGIDDIEIVTLGTGEPAAKANYVISLIDEHGYNFIEFFDDSKRNIDTMANTIKSTYPNVKIRMHHIKSHINEMRKRKIVNERVKHGSSYPPTFDEFTELTAQQQGDIWIFFDTESTGLQYENEEVQATQLSCIAYYTNNFETMPEEVSGGRFDIKLALSEATEDFMKTEPESKFSIKNLLLMTDYADDTVKKVKPGYVIHEFEEYLHRMKEMSSTKKIVFIAQNSPFDVGIINTLYHRMAVQPPDHEVWDTKAVIDLYFKPVLAFLKNSPDVTEEDKDLISRLTVNGRISGSLGNITSAFNIKNDKWHQAIEDVRMTMEMMFKIMQYLRAKSPEIRNTVASSPFNAMAGDPVYGVSSYKKRQMSENKLRALVNEIINESTIADSPITFEFKETTRGFGEEYSVFLRHPDFEKHVGYVQVILYWDFFDNVSKDTVIKGKGVRIFTVKSTFIDKKFRGEGLGSQMYKFLIANLSKLEIALVPAEWVDENDSVVTYDNEEEPRGPLNRGQHGTSNLALNVWKNFKIPAFYPEWVPKDYSTFRSVRRRGWDERDRSNTNLDKHDEDN